MADWRQVPLSVVGLPTLTLNALLNTGYERIGEMERLDDYDLLALPLVGKVGLAAIRVGEQVAHADPDGLMLVYEYRDFDRLPARVKAIVLEAKAGKTLCMSYEANVDERSYFWEPGGKAVPRVSAEAATKTRFMVPANDGLFPGATQTWKALKW